MNTEKDNKFGQRLKYVRLKEGKTQKQFAEMLELQQPTLSGYENGTINPTGEALVRIAEKLGVSIDWLYGRDMGFNLRDMGDVQAFFMELFETNEFSIETTIHDRVDMEDPKAKEDKDRNWVDLKIYHNEVWRNSEATLNMSLAQVITEAYKKVRNLRRYELSQEKYEREKAESIEYGRTVPITKVDHSNVSEEESRKRMLEFMKEEWEAMEKKNEAT